MSTEHDPGTAAPLYAESSRAEPPRDPYAEPERLMIVPRRVEDGTLLLVLRAEGTRPGLLSTDPPHPDEGLTLALDSILRTQLNVTVVGAPLVSPSARPAHMPLPRRGSAGTGWLRVVALDVTGTPEADPTLAGVVTLDATAAREALSTDLERLLLADALTLFNAQR
ncbi:MAG: hypothetical protein O2798_11155 [Chloroflexi bacterium]|nr:hypothetical protein [Chloroflexota bacterium]